MTTIGGAPAAFQPDRSARPEPIGPFQAEREARNHPAVQAVYEAFRTDPGQGRAISPNLGMLEAACEAAGVELGAYDSRILAWLANWEPMTCAVIAGIIARAAPPARMNGHSPRCHPQRPSIDQAEGLFSGSMTHDHHPGSGPSQIGAKSPGKTLRRPWEIKMICRQQADSKRR